MTSGLKSPAQFQPLQKASSFRRVLTLVLGPLMWLVALIVASLVVYGVDAVEIGIIVTFVAFLLGLILCWVGRRRRLSDEEAVEAG